MPFSLDLEKMTRPEKLQAMEALWNDLSREESMLESPAWHGECLAVAEEALRSGTASFDEWKLAKEKIAVRLGKRQ